MDRSRTNTRTDKAGYTEQSYPDPNYYLKLKQGLPLQNASYRWVRYDAQSAFSNAGGSLVTDFDAAGFDYFANSVITGSWSLNWGGELKKLESLSLLHQRLANQLLQKIHNGEFNAGIALGEHKQTARLFADGVRGTVRNMERYRIPDHSYQLAWEWIHNKPISKFLRRKAEAAARAWLIFSYGLKPLYNDIVGAAQALARSHGEQETMKMQTVTAKIPDMPINVTSTYQSGYVTVRGKCSGKVDCNAFIDFYVTNELWRTAQLYGITNLTAVAWELVPYSFVFDWFVPIGSYLQTLEPPAGVTFRNGNSYVKGHGASERYTVITDRSPAWNTRMWERSVIKDRVALANFPQPKLIIPDLSLSKSQIASALALMVNILPKVKR